MNIQYLNNMYIYMLGLKSTMTFSTKNVHTHKKNDRCMIIILPIGTE